MANAKHWTILPGLFLAVIITAAGFAQGIQGALSGTVVDQTGLVIPGAVVTLTNVETGDVRTQITTGAGIYEFPNLPISQFTLKVTMPGFITHEQLNISIKANQTVEVNVTMKVGGATEVITVTEGAALVTTNTAQLEGFEIRNVSDLPSMSLNGNPINLAMLAPGTTSQSGGVAGEGGSIGGNRPRNNNFVVDGVDNNDPSVTGSLTPVIQDAVSEFTLLTNQFSAEYGHSTAGQFITTTRSGTNNFHGRGWWYMQNRRTNSLDNITRAVTPPGGEKPRYDWNRVGGQIGGPIAQNKLFFFGSFEFRNQTLAGTPSGIILAPTAAGLSTLESLAGTPGSGVSPVNIGILSNQVPVAATATTTTPVLNEATGQMVPVEVGQFSSSSPNFDRTHLFLVSVDYHAGFHRLSARFNYSRNRYIEPGELPVTQFNSNAAFDTRRVTFSDVWTVNARAVNEFRFGWNRAINDFPVDLPAAPGQTDTFANYDINDLNLFIGPQSNYPQGGGDNTYQFTENFTIVRGAHTLKMGFELRNIISTTDFLPRARGEYEWTGLNEFVRDQFPTAVSIRGVGLGAFSANRSAYYGYFQDNWKLQPRLNLQLGLRYEYTTTSRDTALQDLNGIANVVSIRDEVYTAELVGESSPLLGQNIFNSLSPTHQEALLAHVGESLIFRKPKADRNNLAPRIGLAWDVFGTGRTSVRAGFGMAHDVMFGNLDLLGLPPQVQAENRETNACLITPRPAWCSLVAAGSAPADADIRFSTTGFIEGGALLSTLPPDTLVNRYSARALTQAYSVDQQLPEVYTWSLSLQHELFQNYLVEARYLGNHAVHLPIQRWVSAGVPNPSRLPVFFTDSEALQTNFSGAPTLQDFRDNRKLLLEPYGFGGVITEYSPDGQSWYNGGSLLVQKRFSRGLSFNANYTFSRTIDLIENDLFTSFMNPRRPYNHLDIFANKGLSGLHHQHKFAISWMWDVPGYRNGSPWMQKVTDGWQISGNYIAESGQPLTIISRNDLNGDFDTAGDTAIENPFGSTLTGTGVNFVCWNGSSAGIAGSASDCGGDSRVVGYVPINPDARYIRGELGAITNVGRNTFESPGLNYWNLAFFKNLPVAGEGRYLQFRWEMWNAFNHPNYGIGSGTVFTRNGNATGFPGYVTPGTDQFLNKTIFSGGLGNAPFQRIMQWGLKFIF